MDELDRIIDNGLIRTVFQPIVSLRDGSVLGYEALSRGPEGSEMERPDIMFEAAKRSSRTWDLELLCRKKAMQAASSLGSDKNLFINVDSGIIRDPKFSTGLTKEILARYGINPRNIIFEITEKTSVEDYKNFKEAIRHYENQGYKIAIDDMGSGYSGLTLLAETRPKYIKIDMGLIRDIDKNSLKQALIMTFQRFAELTDMKIIAEGIETVDELYTLIELGVSYGQGYYLQRPAGEFLDIPTRIKAQIADYYEKINSNNFASPASVPIGDIARFDMPVSPYALGIDIENYFNDHPNVQGVAVVHNSVPLGLVMKDRFYYTVSRMYGREIFLKRPISLVMDTDPLTVDCNTPLSEVARQAMARSDEKLYDYVIITKEGRYHGVTSVKRILDRTTSLELNIAKYSNPLTGLPGNLIIEENLKRVINSDGPFSVIYADLDNFKPYNDVYGFENGDKVLAMTASLLREALTGTSGSFLGHVGGDDFVAVIPSYDIEDVVKWTTKMFDRRILSFYNELDIKREFIVAEDRHGRMDKFPIMSISLAIVTNENKTFASVEQLTEEISATKAQCKCIGASCYLINAAGEKA